MNSGTVPPMGTAATIASRDDRILPETRWIALFIIPFLIAAFVILFFFPHRTDTMFAWTIRPTMTPLMMGAGYVSGIYFFTRLFLAPHKWHWFRHGFLPITTFTWFMGIATLLHWDRFHHGTLTFYAWTGLYILTPFLVPFLWYRNRHTDPGTFDANDTVVPPLVRWILGMVGTMELFLALFMFLLPMRAMELWPWTLTPLTARVIGGWFALHGVLGLSLSQESRWSGMRIMVQIQLISLSVMGVAIVRAWGDFDKGCPMTWVFVPGTAFWLIVLAVIHLQLNGAKMETNAR